MAARARNNNTLQMLIEPPPYINDNTWKIYMKIETHKYKVATRARNNIAVQMIIEPPPYIHKNDKTWKIYMIIETQKIMDNRSLPYIQTLEQTTITLTMINLAQQIFLFSGLPVDFFVPFQSFFLSSLVNMYTKILISQQQEEEWREFAKSWILVLNLHVAAFSRRIYPTFTY